MFGKFQPITIQDVRESLGTLTHIERPEGDNDGEHINSSSVYDLLSCDDQCKVDNAWATVRGYVLEGDGTVNRRALTLVGRSFPISLGPQQYDWERLSGHVDIGEWSLYIGDEVID